MDTLLDHARAFRGTRSPGDLSTLAEIHRPEAMFVSCSDARVVPALITGAQPGQLFELRTAGNIVPRHGLGTPCAVAATIQFAVCVLEVPEIVVCGHSHCGAVKALLGRAELGALPDVRAWLTRSGYSPGGDRPDAGDALDRAVQRHLLVQMEHLRSYPWIGARVAAGRLRLHAWHYAVESGAVAVARPDGTFEAL